MTSPVSNSVYTRGTGTTSTSVFITVFYQRNPTANDVNFQVTQRWVNTLTAKEFILTGFTSAGGFNQAVWLNITNGTIGALDELSGNAGSNPVTADGSNNINVFGDNTSINISGDGSHTLTASVILPSTDYEVLIGRINSLDGVTPAVAGLFLMSNGVSALPSWSAVPDSTEVWSDQSGSFTAAANNGYFIIGASTPLLPASPSEGNRISFICDTSSLLTITANTGQKIRLGTAISASAGTCECSSEGNAVSLVYRTIGTTWLASSLEGTWLIT